MSEPQSLPPELIHEIHLLSRTALEGSASVEELDRLDRIVCQNPAARRYLARSLQTCTELRRWAAGHRPSQPGSVPTSGSPVLGFLNRTMHAGSDFRLNSFLIIAGLAGLFLILSLVAIVPAYLGLRRAELENAQREQREEQERELAASQAQESARAKKLTDSRPKPPPLLDVYAKLASERNPLHTARALGDSVAWVYAHGLAQARLTFAVDCRWRGATPDVGESLTRGRRLELKAGLAEIVFQNGARTILQGPATLQILSGSGAYLKIGRYTVNVEDPRAKGFEVGTPGMKYTDLGTEFGVMVDADGEQEMHVFRGKVQAEQKEIRDQRSEVRDQKPGDLRRPTSDLGPLTSPILPPTPRPLILSAHQAIRVTSPAEQGQPPSPIESMVASENQFVREMPRDRFPLFSTGVGLDRGAADPHWSIAAVSTDPKFQPRPAVVAVPPSAVYRADSRETAQWISLTKVLSGMPGGCRMTFHTEFDLSGFDPASARIEGECTADDWVTEVRLNGRAVAMPPVDKKLVVPTLPLHIERDFRAGQNTLDIVVENSGIAGTTQPTNVMALYTRCRGTAMRLPDTEKQGP